MKNLLAVVGDGAADVVLQTTWQLAFRFKGRMACLYRPSLERLAWEPADASYPDPLARRRDRENWAKAGFERFLRVQGMAAVGQLESSASADVASPAEDQERPCAVWLAPGGPPRPPGVLGRIYDMIVLAQPGSLASLPGADFEEALCESGRPVLIVPRGGSSETLGARIGIAWNGSAETAHAVALAMPLLVRAAQVVVIAVEAEDMPSAGPGGVEVARALTRRGINVALRTIGGRQKRQGTALLEQAAAAEVDLLVKGAYACSRWRQMMLGGATRHIILHSPIPVLMGR